MKDKFLTSCLIINAASQNPGYANMHTKGNSLLSRLRLDSKKDDDFSPVPGQLLRKYVAYARNFVNPK